MRFHEFTLTFVISFYTINLVQFVALLGAIYTRPWLNTVHRRNKPILSKDPIHHLDKKQYDCILFLSNEINTGFFLFYLLALGNFS